MWEAAQGVVRAGVSKAEFEAPCSKSSLCVDLCRKWVLDWMRPRGPGPPYYRSLAKIGSQLLLSQFSTIHKIKTCPFSSLTSIHISFISFHLSPFNMH